MAHMPTPARAAARAAAAATAAEATAAALYSQRVLAQQTCRFLYAGAAGSAAPAESEALAGAIRYAAAASADVAEALASPLDWVSQSWRVVHRPSVNVRAQPDRKSRVVQQKKFSTIVWGAENEGWIQLEGEPGFMMIANQAQCLLKRTDESPDIQPIKDDGPCLPLLECPWREHLAQFVSTRDLSIVAGASSVARKELTVEPEDEWDDGRRRRLLVPLVELKLETAEEELQRVSLPHARSLRIWSRLSFDAASAEVRRGGAGCLRSLEKLMVKGCPLFPLDVKNLLGPVITTAARLTTLNLEKNQLLDATIQALVASGALEAAPNLESVNIRFNRVGDAAAIALAESPAVARLKWINLKMNCITDKGALALAGMLKNNISMTLINLRKQCPGLTDKTAYGFAETLRSTCVLEQVRLRRNKISDTGAAALAGAMASRFMDTLVPPAQRLELDLEENRIKDAGALALLKAASVVPKHVRLEVLLSGNGVSRASLGSAVLEVDESQLDALNPRLIFDSKPDGCL